MKLVLSPQDPLLKARRQTQLAAARILRKAAGLMAGYAPYWRGGCCAAISDVAPCSRQARELASRYFQSLLKPRQYAMYYWSLESRGYNQREARILALLLAAESLEHP